MKDRCPLISIIIPVYNTEKYLSRCIDSVINQTYRNLEILIVNDGSTDNSGAICDSYAQQESRIRVFHKKNGGLSSARNFGIDVCSGEYLGFVDSDDWIEPNMYDTMLHTVLDRKTQICVCGRYDVDSFTGNRTVGLCPQINEVISSEECVGRMLIWDGLDSSAVDKLFSKDLFTDVRFPLGRLSEDVAILYRVVFKTTTVSLINIPFYNYYHRENSITTSNVFNDAKLDTVKHSEIILSWIKEHYPLLVSNAMFFRASMIVYAYEVVSHYDLYSNQKYKQFIR